MGSSNSGRQTESSLKQNALNSGSLANTAIAKADTPDPLEQRRRDRVNRILDWDEKPTSVRDFPDQSAIALYTDAKRVTDAGRVGKGYGSLTDGANANYVASLDKEYEHERGLAASGMLEEHVNNSIMGARAEAGDLSAMGNARNMNVAQMRNSNYNADQDRWLAYLTRPKQDSFLKKLALGGVSGLASNPALFAAAGV